MVDVFLEHRLHVDGLVLMSSVVKARDGVLPWLVLFPFRLFHSRVVVLRPLRRRGRCAVFKGEGEIACPEEQFCPMDRRWFRGRQRVELHVPHAAF